MEYRESSRMKNKHILFLTGSIFSLLSQNAFSAAYQLYELGTPIIGIAGVGQAVMTDDASSSYFNPAGMIKIKNSEFLLGSQIILPKINFSKNNTTTISGNNGGNAATILPGLGAYIVYNYSDNLKWGVNFASPYGGSLTYNDGWAGRYDDQTLFLYTLDLNPSVAYRINDLFSVGAGLTAEYANLSETVALPIPDTIVDGQANIKVSNLAFGGNVGVLFTPRQTTKIGLTYRSQISHNLTGNLTFLRLTQTPAISTRLIMPQNLILSASQNITDKFTLLGEAGWAQWSAMRNLILNVQGYTAATPLNFNNTYRLGLGGQYQFTPSLMMQLGVSYDSSPTSASQRLPELPFDRQVRAGVGAKYTVFRVAQIGLSYEYINFGRAAINNVSSNGVLSGYYKNNYANVLQASVNIFI